MGKVIQIFSPHPDDVEVFCGGTLLAHHHNGDEIHIVMMTRGGDATYNPILKGGPLRRIQTREVEERMNHLPNAKVVWLDCDGSPCDEERAFHKVVDELKRVKPDIVYLPEHDYRSLNHDPAHRTTGEIVERAVKYCRQSMTLRFYHSKTNNRLIYVEKYERERKEAQRIYESRYQLSAKPSFKFRSRDMVRKVFLRSWGLKNCWRIHQVINEWVEAANLPLEKGTEAYREVSSRSVAI